ncbi:hypothetical protein PHYBOEH_009799 [Phytophthora boehmeriae]|uniref:5'-3' DNA helicase ZGRF1-like N-terminal domain-containing protein n=1 Tax=Phytophthora boehmeriae TaxID=109152 RepID=A0A8T1VS37_9STRA|nr:hypothetical protein PHYBOEH_009799 [Phytophthora boehmeriae]
MTKLCDLLGTRAEVVYECMYTKHKTQKRKTWHDGFVALYASRKLVLYDDAPPVGKVIDEANLAPFDWERKDEEHIVVPKFLVEIINETPVGSAAAAQTVSSETSNRFQPISTTQQSYGNGNGARVVSSAALGGRPRASNSKFRTPLSRGPARLSRPGENRVGHPYSRNAPPAPSASPAPTTVANPAFDFARNPTSEWTYVPNAINRTPDEVLALLNK